MSRLFITMRRDPRALTTPQHRIARQSVGERRRIHGAIRPMPANDPLRAYRLPVWQRVSTWLGLGTAAWVALYFLAQLFRGAF